MLLKQSEQDFLYHYTFFYTTVAIMLLNVALADSLCAVNEMLWVILKGEGSLDMSPALCIFSVEITITYIYNK